MIAMRKAGKYLSITIALAMIITSMMTLGEGTILASEQLAAVGDAADPSEIVNLTLQNGLNGYNGSKDVSTIMEYPIGHDSEWIGYYAEGRNGGLRLWDNGDKGWSGLIYFDVSQIPVGSQITSARLKMYSYWGPGGYGTIDMYRIIDNDNKGMWVEGDKISEYKTSGAAWLKRAGNTADWSDAVGWTNAAGSSIMDSVVSAPTGTMDITPAVQVGWNVTSDLKDDVQAWVNGFAPNQGWYLRPRPGTGVHAFFASNQCESNPDAGNNPAYRPMLEITYVPGTGTVATPTSTPIASPTATPQPTATPVPTTEATPTAVVTALPPASTPEPPRVLLDTTYAPPTGGRTITVPAGGDLQAALDQANPGDIIELQAGATYTGNFVLPKKTGDGWIYIQTSAYSSLPAQGTRVSPWDAGNMPKIVSPNVWPAIKTAESAHHYRFVGIEITTTHAVTTSTHWNLISLEADNQTQLSQVPDYFTFDRCYIHGTPTGNIRRGIGLNSANTAVIDSYLSDFHEVGADNQAIGGWNGPGPYKIVNNYLEGACENVMFGGSDAAIQGLVPSDIEVRKNHFFKPLSWKVDDPSYAGIHWSVKNIFELKSARRVLVEGNVFENNWVDAQNGTAILFTIRNQDGGNPWNIIEDVSFTNNILRNSTCGFNILGEDYLHPSLVASDILIKNNVVENISSYWMVATGGAYNVTIDHNTGFQDGSIIVADGIEKPNRNWTVTNNMMVKGSYGIFGSAIGEGNNCINSYFPGMTFAKNVVIGATASWYPAGNFFPAAISDVQFEDYSAGDYRLKSTSPYNDAGTDLKDIGADIEALNAAVAGVKFVVPPTPVPTASPLPTPSPTPGPGSTKTFDFGRDNMGTGAFQFTYSDGTAGTMYGKPTTLWTYWTQNNIFNDRGSSDAYVEFKFFGTGITLNTEVNPWCGIAAVSILDANRNVEVSEQDVDCFAPEGAYPAGKAVYSSPYLPYGEHILRVRVTDRINPLNPYVYDGNNPPANPYWSINLYTVDVHYSAVTPTPTSTPEPVPTSTPEPTPTSTPVATPTASPADVTGPVIQQPEALTLLQSNALNLRITATDEQSGVKEITVKFDGAPVANPIVKDAASLPIGDHTINVRAVDNENNVTEQIFILTVAIDTDSLDELLIAGAQQGWINGGGILNSLQSKVKSIQKDKADGKKLANSLKAFENEIKAQKGKKISSSFAQLLLDDIAYLGL